MSDIYDIIIVGAGPAGCALAHSLSQVRPKHAPALRIALVERSLAQPDRIVGELLQPGGMAALAKLGLTWCTEDIDAVPCHGYCVVLGGTKKVHIPYPNKEEGRSFHHGPFVMQLRKAARMARGVDVIEATVLDLIEDSSSSSSSNGGGRARGVRINRKDPSNPVSGSSTTEELFAEIIIAADGGHSKFRSALGTHPRAPVAKSQFFAAILKHAPLPMKHHGTVSLVPGSGPVLMYQIDSTETRMLADIRLPLPTDSKAHLLNNVVPGLPKELQACVVEALEKDRLRSMPNSFLPAAMQGQHGSKEGVILIGDSWNMRHPLTGGGMTVAFNDVVYLTDALTPFLQDPAYSAVSPKSEHDDSTQLVSSSSRISVDWDDLREALREWHWTRKGLSSTINILSVALYDLFSADGEDLAILREGCFAYFELGGECVDGPVSLLAGLAPSPMLLARHFFTVALYAIYIYWTKPQYVPSSTENGKLVLRKPSPLMWPAMMFRSLSAFWTAVIVFGPLVWTEIRWW